VTTSDEDVPVTDDPLYRIEADPLRARALHWVGFTFIATLACVCVVAIALGSVPAALATAVPVLSATLTVVVRVLFRSRAKG
jgi:uncharacterized membrane protein